MVSVLFHYWVVRPRRAVCVAPRAAVLRAPLRLGVLGVCSRHVLQVPPHEVSRLAPVASWAIVHCSDYILVCACGLCLCVILVCIT
jgi:hypothetical protein